MKHTKKYDEFNKLQKYREFQRRTKLLYGVKDLKLMVKKSKDSQEIFRKFHDKEKDKEERAKIQENNEEESKKKFSLKQLLKVDNFIIGLNSEWKSIFDTVLLLVIGYTCITTVFFVSYQIVQN